MNIGISLLNKTLVLLLVIFCMESHANAGVLFGNRRQVIRTQTPQFVQRVYTVRKSSAVLSATNPRLTATSYGGVSDQMKLIKSRYKYDVALAKWEKKHQENIAKQVKKQKSIAEREAKRKQRESERLKRKQERDKEKIKSASNNTSGGISSAASQNTSRGSLSSMIGSQSGKKKGFWASLYQALFAKKSS